MTGLEFEEAHLGRRVRVNSYWIDSYEGIVLKYYDRMPWSQSLVLLKIDDETTIGNGDTDLRFVDELELLPDKHPLPLPG